MARDPFFLDDEDQADEPLASGAGRVPPDDEPVGVFLPDEVAAEPQVIEPQAPAPAAMAAPDPDPREPALQAWRAGRFEEAERLLTALAASAGGEGRESEAAADVLFDL